MPSKKKNPCGRYYFVLCTAQLSEVLGASDKTKTRAKISPSPMFPKNQTFTRASPLTPRHLDMHAHK